MKPETEGTRWEAAEGLGAGCRQRREHGRIRSPGSTTAHSINPHGRQGEYLICLQHMQALIYKCLHPLRKTERGFWAVRYHVKSKLTGKLESERFNSRLLWSLMINNLNLIVFPTI